MKRVSKIFIIILGVVALYVVTAIPLGMLVYTWKTQKGIDVFSSGGLHSFARCIRQEANRARINESILHERAAERERVVPASE